MSCHIRRLLTASENIRRLAVGWKIWARCQSECGALQLESLYLIWDRTHPTSAPSLKCLQHPPTLTDSGSWERNAFPPTGRALTSGHDALRLAYVTYAADRTPIPTVGSLCEEIPDLRGSMFVLVDIPEKYTTLGIMKSK
jgi:hypothetical protein